MAEKPKLSLGAIAGLLGGVAALITAIVSLVNVLKEDGIQTVAVPTVVGMTEQAAQVTLQNNRLIPGTSEYREDPTEAPGIVLEQKVQPGIVVAERTLIDLVVAKEIETVVVPSMVDLPLAIVKTTLQNNGLVLGRIDERTHAKRPGTVLEHSPAGGETVAKRTPVNLLVAAEPRRVAVPNLIGMSIDRARATLARAHLSARPSKKRTGQAPVDTVLSQAPLPGTRVPADTVVRIVVASALDPGLVAYYKLDGTPNDHAGVSSNFSLQNTRFVDDSLYLNGRYQYSQEKDGYRAVARLQKFDYEHFTVALDFRAVEFSSKKNVILFGGTSYRWFGLRWNQNRLELTLNNQRFKHVFEGTKLAAGRWHNVICSVDLDKRQVHTMLDGSPLETVTLPNDFKLEVIGSSAEARDKNITFTNYSSATVFHGFASNLRVLAQALSAEQMARWYSRIKMDTPRTTPRAPTG